MNSAEKSETVTVGESNVATKESVAQSESEPLTKRGMKFTAKGLAFFMQTCQKKRSAKFKQAMKYIESMRELMESTENVKSVQGHLCDFIKCYEEAMEKHNSFINMNLPEEEVERQNTYVNAKMMTLYGFTQEVKGWLSAAGHPHVISNENDVGNETGAERNENGFEMNENVDNDVLATQTEQSGIIDDINPEDSASNISCQREKSHKTH